MSTAVLTSSNPPSQRRRAAARNDTDVDLAIDLLSGPLTYRALVTGKKLDGLLARSLAGVILIAFGAR